MGKRGDDASAKAFRLVKYTELSQDRRAVVINSLTGQAVFVSKCENSAQWKLDWAPGCRKSAPCPNVPPTNDGLQNDALGAHVPAQDINFQVRQRAQQLFIEVSNLLVPHIVSTFWFIVIAGLLPERRHDASRSCAFSNLTCSSTVFNRAAEVQSSFGVVIIEFPDHQPHQPPFVESANGVATTAFLQI